MATKTYTGNTASRGSLNFRVGETLTYEKAYQNNVEGYNVKVTRYLWCSMSTGGVAVSGSVCNGATSVNAGNNGTTTIINKWYKAGTKVSISACSVTIKLNSINATSSLAAQTFTLPAPTYAPISSATGTEISKDTTNTITLKWTPNTATQTFEYGIRYGEIVLDSGAISPDEIAEQTATLEIANNTLASYIPDSRNITIQAYLTTVGVGESVKDITLSFAEPSGFEPTSDNIAAASSHSTNIYQDFRGFYKGYSTARITFPSINYKGGAEFGNAKITLANNSTLGRTLTEDDLLNGISIGAFGNSGTETITFTLTDSRDYEISKTISITISDYTAININGFYADRCTSTGEEDTSGTYAHPHGTIPNKLGTIGYSIVCEALDGTGTRFTKNGNITIGASTRLENLVDLVVGNGLMDTEIKYSFNITLMDGVGSNFVSTYNIQSSYAMVEFNHSKNGIGFLGATANDKEFSIGNAENGDIKLILNGEDLRNLISLIRSELEDAKEEIENVADDMYFHSGDTFDFNGSWVHCPGRASATTTVAVGIPLPKAIGEDVVGFTFTPTSYRISGSGKDITSGWNNYGYSAVGAGNNFVGITISRKTGSATLTANYAVEFSFQGTITFN